MSLRPRFRLLPAEAASVDIVDGVLRIATPFLRIELKNAGQVLVHALVRTLNDGDDPRIVEDALATTSPNELTKYYEVIQRLCKAMVLQVELVGNDAVHATIIPMAADFMVDATADVPPSEARWSRFVTIRREGGHTLIESPMASARIEVFDPTLLERCATWMHVSHIVTVDDDDRLVTSLLYQAGILRVGEDDDATLAQWSPTDMLFHFRSRFGRHTLASGGVFRHAGRIDPPGVDRPHDPNERLVPLPVPTTVTSRPLEDLISVRRSARAFSQHPMTLEQLGTLLWRTMRETGRMTMDVAAPDGTSIPFELRRRPMPSGGAAHEIDVYLTIRNVDGVAPGFWRYDGARHVLVHRADVDSRFDIMWYRAMEASGTSAPPPVLMTFGARFTRIMWKYESMAYAAILKHVGVIYELFYLVATDMDLGICALGNGDTMTFSSLAGVDPYVEGSVGEMLLGIPVEEEIP